LEQLSDMAGEWMRRWMSKKWVWLAWFLLLVSAAAYLGFRHEGKLARQQMRHCPLPDDSATARPGMVWIPAGQYQIGGNMYAEEMPRLPRQVDGFWMDRTEVTRAQFAAFVAATGYVTQAERPLDPRQHPGVPAQLLQPGAVVFTAPTDLRRGGDLSQWWRYTPGANWRQPDGPEQLGTASEADPVVSVTYEDAMAYARWKGHDLPTEAEWEWAARAGRTDALDSGTSAPAQANTWQGLFPVHNLAEDGFTGRAPVGCFQANAYGLYDMIGNVWELTRDLYFSSHRTDVLTQARPAVASGSAAQYVIKGGSYLCAENYCRRYRAEARQGQEGDLGAGHVGFRTVYRPKAGAGRP
jgi:formylglycine-generating enzyme